jgi:hypothetical protein
MYRQWMYRTALSCLGVQAANSVTSGKWLPLWQGYKAAGLAQSDAPELRYSCATSNLMMPSSCSSIPLKLSIDFSTCKGWHERGSASLDAPAWGQVPVVPGHLPRAEHVAHNAHGGHGACMHRSHEGSVGTSCMWGATDKACLASLGHPKPLPTAQQVAFCADMPDLVPVVQCSSPCITHV